jgi:hydrogenase nickel insertion protein HypA
MHEYTLMQGIIKAILERLEEEQATAQVEEVVLKVGVLDIHSESAAQQAFEVLSKGTSLENAKLTIEAKPVMLNCPKCRSTAPYGVGEHIHAHELLPVVSCPVCHGLANLTGGEGVESIELIFED